MKNHERVPDPTEADKIVDIAIDLLDRDGVQSKTSPELVNAVYYVGDHDVDGKYPSLSINVPKKEVADKYGWRVELAFGNQDAALSTHILIRKDGSAVMSDYSGKYEDEELTDERLEGLSKHLDSIKDNLIVDHQQ